MDRGNLISYDLTGKVFSQTGEASGVVVDHEIPVGIPYMILPYGTMSGKRLNRIDVSDPNNHSPIFEEIIREPSYEELENQLLLAKGVI